MNDEGAMDDCLTCEGLKHLANEAGTEAMEERVKRMGNLLVPWRRDRGITMGRNDTTT